MRLNLKDRRTMLRAFCKHYRNASKGHKSRMLDEFVWVTGYNRSHAARALRSFYPINKIKSTRPNRVTYGDDVRMALEQIWATLNYVCGKRLVAALPDVLETLIRHNEIAVTRETKRKLLQISAATADRILARARANRGRKKPLRKHPNSYLFAQIPIKTFGEWEDVKPSFLQIDLVAHNGGNIKSGHLWSLNATDVATTWTISVPVSRKTEFCMLKALSKLRKAFPFPVRGLDTDNGSEFVNAAVFAFCQRHGIEFTRARPYKKNDSCFIEQKNHATVRRNVGWFRYETGQREILVRLYSRLELYSNYFLPTMKLLSKTRQGAKTYRKYDSPQTPLQRVLSSQDIPRRIKTGLRRKYLFLNPAALRREMDTIQQELIQAIKPEPRRKLNKERERRPKIVYHKEPARRRLHNDSYANPFMEKLNQFNYHADLKKVWALREEKSV